MSPFKMEFKEINGRGKGLLLLWIFLISSPIHAGSIKDVNQNILQVRSIEPPFQFAIIGDSQRGEKVYTQLIQDILKRKPNFIIHLGDMIHIPHEKEWQEFFEISKPIHVPFFPVVGNHDIGTTRRGEEIYRKQFHLPEGKTYYAFRAGGGLFIILDSEKDKRKIINEQWLWLEDILSSSNETLRLIFLHAPLFLPADSLRRGGGMDKYPFSRNSLHRLFVKTKVKAVFAGDDHRYDRREKEDVLYIISGGGGASIYAFDEKGGFFHYVWISVQNGKVEGEVIELGGKIRDRFVIE